jgi:hypothetical protein
MEVGRGGGGLALLRKQLIKDQAQRIEKQHQGERAESIAVPWQGSGGWFTPSHIVWAY